jgi:outer membrane immunogenic protein
MKRTIIAAAVLGASFGAAEAADLAARPYTKAPPPVVVAAYNWSGFYLGVNAGGGWSHKCWDITQIGPVALAPLRPDGCHNGYGPTAGGQFGYRWQSAAWVFGVEAQGNWANIKGDGGSVFFGPPNSNRSTIDALGLFTGQVGYAWNNALFYVKGGAAVTRDKYEGFVTGPVFPVSVAGQIFDRGNETRWGGAVGAGLEFGFGPNWTAAIEYDHLFMGTRDVSLYATVVTPGALSRTARINQDVDLFTLRFNYRFGGPVIARY